MPVPLQFGIIRPFCIPWPEIVSQWQHIEAVGFDSVWGIDHFNRPTDPGAPLFESWTTLAALAASTSRIRIGLLVTSNTFRHPALLAKEAVTVDHISHGRLEFGIGAGGYEPEHRTFGLHYPEPPERVDRLRETIEAIALLMTQDVSSYCGQYVQLNDAPFRPAPIQRPRPPFTIAAHGPKMIDLAAKHGTRWNSYGSINEMAERIKGLSQACHEIGRNPSELTRSLYARTASLGLDPWESPDRFVEIVESYRRVGVNEFIFDPPSEAQWPSVERIAADVLPLLRLTT